MFRATVIFFLPKACYLSRILFDAIEQDASKHYVTFHLPFCSIIVTISTCGRTWNGIAIQLHRKAVQAFAFYCAHWFLMNPLISFGEAKITSVRSPIMPGSHQRRRSLFETVGARVDLKSQIMPPRRRASSRPRS
jgi:hypothetical protein